MTMHGNAMPCRINGIDYPSQAHAARDLGVTRAAISQAIIRGKTNHVGTNHSRLGNKNRGRKVRLLNVEFPSRKDAAAALGMNRTTLSRMLDKGGPDAMQTLLGAAMKRDLLAMASA